MLLFCLVSTSLSAPCPLKDHVALASLSFINGMSVPSCVVALGEGMVHLRRGLRPLRPVQHGIYIESRQPAFGYAAMEVRE